MKVKEITFINVKNCKKVFIQIKNNERKKKFKNLDTEYSLFVLWFWSLLFQALCIVMLVEIKHQNLAHRQYSHIERITFAHQKISFYKCEITPKHNPGAVLESFKQIALSGGGINVSFISRDKCSHCLIVLH